MRFKEIEHDFYSNGISYYKLIMKYLNKENTQEEIIVKEIYNGILNSLNEDSLKKKYYEILFITALLENKSEIIKEDFESTYESLIKSLILCYINGDLDMVKYLFNYVHDKFMMLSGYNYLVEMNVLKNNKNIKK